jgi:hypothetical protein
MLLAIIGSRKKRKFFQSGAGLDTGIPVKMGAADRAARRWRC